MLIQSRLVSISCVLFSKMDLAVLSDSVYDIQCSRMS